MHNNNNIYSKYSLSQKSIPTFTSTNYYNNYFNEQNQINKPKRIFDDNEIIKIIENCKNNLKRLQNIYINNNQKKFPNYNNNIKFIDYNNYYNYNHINKNIKYYKCNNLNKNKNISIKLPLNNNYKNFNGNNTNKINTNININTNKSNNQKQGLNQSLSRNNITNNNLNNNFFNYEYCNKENNKIYDCNQLNYKGYFSQRDFYNNKDNKDIEKNKNKINVQSSNNLLKINKNKNGNKNDVFYKNEQEKYNKNYLILINDLKKLKSTVVNYKKTNLELKHQIQQLNNKIKILSKKNNTKFLNIEYDSNNEEEMKEQCYIKKRINSFRGKINNKNEEKYEFNHDNNDINNIGINNNIRIMKFNSNLDKNGPLKLEHKNNQNKKYINTHIYNSTNDINKYILKQNKSEKEIKIKEKKKSRNIFNDFKIIKNSSTTNNSLYSNNYNNNNTTRFTQNNNGRIANISELLYNNTNYNNNNNIIENNLKDEIIEKKIFLKKKNKDSKNIYRTTNCSTNLDMNELYKMTKNNNNNFSDTSNVNQSQFPKNEIIINLSRISSDKNNNNKNKKKYNSSLNIFNNYIYQKKTKEIKSKSLSRKANNKNNESSKKIEMIKVPLNKINVSPVKKNNENVKSSRIVVGKLNIENNNLISIYKNKNAILQRLLKNNNKSYNFNTFENNSFFLFGIDDNKHLIQFDIALKQFSTSNIYEIKDISKTFYKDYMCNYSILLNTLKGLYILTGINTNILYFYDNEKKYISKICKFNHPHNKGSLLLDLEKDRIFVFSGKNTKKCEFYSFKEDKIIEIPELNIDRINASYTKINNKIFCLFGYSCNKNQNLNCIETIDCEKLDKWEKIIISIKFDFIFERNLNIIFNKELNNIYLYIEGKEYDKNKIERIICLYDINKNEINKMEDLIIEEYKEEKCLWKKVIDVNEEKYNNEYYFDKNFNFLELPKEMNNNYFDNNNDNIAVILDNKNNAYFFYKNQMKIERYIKFF